MSINGKTQYQETVNEEPRRASILRNRGRRGKKRKTEEWKIFYANARGILSKRNSLIDILGDLRPQVALITETMLTHSHGLQIDGYSYIGKLRMGRSGGVGILVSNNVKGAITPHETSRNIEIIWISINRKLDRPLFLGVYYGKQETRTNKEEIGKEMDELTEEIMDIQKEGNVILFMDGNGKIGILGEEPSRNGKLLMKVFEDTELGILNKSEKCEGQVTRVNRSNSSEKSAIDFVVATKEFMGNVKSMKIDESETYVLQGKSRSDHNSIVVNVCIDNIRKNEKVYEAKWRLNAPPEKWAEFRAKIDNFQKHSCALFKNRLYSMEEKYRKWTKEIEKRAMDTIGKTTMRSKKRIESELISTLRKKKKRQDTGLKKKRTLC